MLFFISSWGCWFLSSAVLFSSILHKCRHLSFIQLYTKCLRLLSIEKVVELFDIDLSVMLDILDGMIWWKFTFRILMQVTVPSLASVFNEYALKSQYDTSIYHQVSLKYWDDVSCSLLSTRGQMSSVC